MATAWRVPGKWKHCVSNERKSFGSNKSVCSVTPGNVIRAENQWREGCKAPPGDSGLDYSQYPKVHNESTFLGSCRSTRSTRRTRRAAPSTACRPGAPGTRRMWRTAAKEDLKIWKKFNVQVSVEYLLHITKQVTNSPQPMAKMNKMLLSSSNVLTRRR